jgi:ATP-dependent protease Clp ATPase subunit
VVAREAEVSNEFMTNCSFCGHPHGGEDREVLIVGPLVSICDVCVELAAEIVAEERSKKTKKSKEIV